MPLKINNPIDIFNHQNDSKFHDYLVSKIKEANNFYFKQFKDL